MGVIFQSLGWDMAFIMACLILFASWYYTTAFSYWSSRGVHSMKPVVFFGNTKDKILMVRSFTDVQADIYRRTDGHKFVGFYDATTPVLMVKDLELIKNVLVRDFPCFMDRGLPSDTRNPINANLFALGGSKWRKLRSKLTPTFTLAKIKTMSKLMVECSEELVEWLEDINSSEDVVEVKEVAAKYTTDVIGSCVFGLQINAIKDPNCEFRVMGRNILEPGELALKHRIIITLFPFLGKLLASRKADINAFFLRIVKDVVSYREKNNVVRDDFIQLLIQLKKYGKVEDERNSKVESTTNQATMQPQLDLKRNDTLEITDSLLAAQCFIFFVAGFETSSTTISCCLHELSLNVAIQDKLRREIYSVLRKHSYNLTYEAIQEMKYLEQVIDETLRKYPPSGFLARTCTKPYTIPNTNVHLEKGTVVIIPVRSIHHDPKYFPCPQRFDPERFSQENINKIPQFAYLPFGEGPRLCIGALSVSAKDCAVRNYGASSTVCVCNATYCDQLEPITEKSVSGGNYVHYVSSKDGHRLKKSTGQFVKSESPVTHEDVVKLTVQQNVSYQEMLGFGGAITDATAINIKNLSDKAAENLMQSYFGEGGSQYTILRNPMGASDFSVEYYTYDDVDGDTELKHFALREEDYKYKIPVIKRAQELNKRGIRLFSSAWSAPYWMKKNGTVSGTSHLLPENYQPWANYYVKYFDAYAKENVTYWGVTAQNEPTEGDINPSMINSMGWTVEQQRDWIVKNLGPTLHQGGYDYLKLMILDDNRPYLPQWAVTVLSNKTARDYVSGVAVHYYADSDTDPAVLSQTHNDYPDKFILYTEACDLHTIVASDLGNWEKGEGYGTSILNAVNNWSAGWTDWNMVLNTEGGPTWSPYPFNAPIIANATADEFYKQPMYYFLAHFSSFVPPGSKRVGLITQQTDNVLSAAFLTPEEETIVVIMNTNDIAKSVTISDSSRGNIAVDIQARSIHTILYK